MKKELISALLSTTIAVNACATSVSSKTMESEEPKEKTIVEMALNITSLVKEYIESNPFYFNPQIEEYNFGYLKKDSNILGIKQDEVIDTIKKYQKVTVINEIDNYYYVQTEDSILGLISKENIEILPDLFVEVDISDQMVYLYKNNELVIASPCVTGMNNKHDTRIGYFSIKYKQTNTYLTGPGYRSYVNYWMPFDGGIGLHDADGWRKTYGGEIYLKNGSHGCVNTPGVAVKEIFNTVSKGTRVLVHK